MEQTPFSLQTDREARHLMVEHQVRAWEVLDPRVLEVMETVPREDFVPSAYRALAFSEANIPLDHGQIMMQPKVGGRVLQAVNVQPGDRVLEVGTGSGYLAACLGALGGQVLSVDCFEDLVKQAEANWKATDTKKVRGQVQESSTLEWTDERFDVIVVTGSMPSLHNSFREKLTVGGRLFVVTGRAPAMEAQLITRMAEDDWAREHLFETNLPALLNAFDPRVFEL
ncbi:protein-L-isoaspartate O-methyltransferase [Gammaproteobacteria bacterium AB-CW1]|uniref:Protein-L-isoaspartate O-methyltransferase n=1 Tax=Natronospira elongata TaxID=3110268 RepID=A0AAP6JH45_9GAMM|nr:protein-L-isoaspartate O-methyltransferase [Gammaproteobacteria bacterium AB-CW1]